MSAQLKQISQNVMALSGDIDRDTVPELWMQFQSVSFGSPHFELMLEKVNRIDSAGLVMLIHLLEHAKNQKCHIMLSFVPDELKILFQLYNVESVFEKHI